MNISKNAEERIKADAAKYCKGVTNSFKVHTMTNAYIAGATAEHERAQKLADALDQFISFHETGLLPARHVYEQAVAARKQWKSGKVITNEQASNLLNPPEDNEPKGMEMTADPFYRCPRCGKELHRDRNLCCRNCGKEVGDEG